MYFSKWKAPMKELEMLMDYFLCQWRNVEWRKSFGRSETRRWSWIQKFCQNDNFNFGMVWQIIGCKMAKTDTQYRAAIPLLIWLAVTFRYLASGESFTNLMYMFKISKQSTSAIISEMCEALTDALRTNIKISNCSKFYSMCCILWDTEPEFVKLTLVQYEN